MNKKIIIFDLDGTLLNTLEDLTNSTNYSLEQLGYPTKSIDQIRNYVGNGVAKLIERAIPDGKSNNNFETCLKLFKENYSRHMYDNTKPYDGIIQLLEQLKTEQLYITVVSNKFDTAVKELCKKYFGNLIDYAAGENELAGIKKKPCPDIIISILKRFNLKEGDAIYVGDSEVDILTAKNASIPCISVTWGFKNREFLTKNGAQEIIDNPNQIIELLKN